MKLNETLERTFAFLILTFVVSFNFMCVQFFIIKILNSFGNMWETAHSSTLSIIILIFLYLLFVLFVGVFYIALQKIYESAINRLNLQKLNLFWHIVSFYIGPVIISYLVFTSGLVPFLDSAEFSVWYLIIAIALREIYAVMGKLIIKKSSALTQYFS